MRDVTRQGQYYVQDINAHLSVESPVQRIVQDANGHKVRLLRCSVAYFYADQLLYYGCSV